LAHYWNDGILEYWDFGFRAFGWGSLRLIEKMESWFIVKFFLKGIK
jgi:hypothetical protein